MQYSVTHTCGHNETVNLFGAGKERESRLAWLRKTACRDCYRTEQTATASRTASEQGLPRLTGSDKQIAWAETIRKEISDKAKALQTEKAAVGTDEQRALLAGIIGRVMAHTDCRYWIDNRGAGIRSLVKAEMTDAERTALA